MVDIQIEEGIEGESIQLENTEKGMITTKIITPDLTRGTTIVDTNPETTGTTVDPEIPTMTKATTVIPGTDTTKTSDTTGKLTGIMNGSHVTVITSVNVCRPPTIPPPNPTAPGPAVPALDTERRSQDT